MKTSGYTLLLFLLVAPHINFSQDLDEKLAAYRTGKFIQEFSIVAGPSVNFLRGNNGVDDTFENEQKYLVGYFFGLQLATKKFFKDFNFISGLFYERKGGKSLTTATYFDINEQVTKQGLIEFRYKYDYYTMPVRIQYSLGQNDQLRIGLGGFASYLNKQVKEREQFFNSFSNSSIDETDRNHTMEYGLSFGIGYLIRLNSIFDITIYAVNNLGIRNIRPDLYSGRVMKTNSTALLIGIAF